MAHANVLEASGVTKRFPNGRGVTNVSLEIAPGDVYGLIGPNGAGKTTLLKLLLGLLRPDAGDIRICGHRVDDRIDRALASVGCLIETAEAYDSMSAYDNLKLAARLYPSLPRSRIDEVLERVGLTAYKKERVGGYSLGMKQRLGLASALLSKPKLVVLDEPGNGLDVEGLISVRTMVRELADGQRTAFLVSSHLIHDLGLMAGRIGIMSGGRLIRQGDAAALIPAGATLEQYVVGELNAAKEASAYGA